MGKWPRQCLAAGKVCRYGRPDSKRPEIHGIWNQAAICRLAIGNRRPSELSQSCRMPQAGDYRDRRKIMRTSLVLRRRVRRAFSSLRTTFSSAGCFTTWSQSSVTASPRLRTSCRWRSTKSLRGKLRRRAREYRHRQQKHGNDIADILLARNTPFSARGHSAALETIQPRVAARPAGSDRRA